MNPGESQSAPDRQPEPVTITPYPDGPYLVRGPFVLQDQEGNELPPGRRTIALCRCGKSRMRPFCDGTHKLIGFRAPSGGEERW
jgi:CDGSH-type Zn-finger protein